MNIKIKASVTLRNGIETDWDTICITQHDIIELIKQKAMSIHKNFNIVECDEIDIVTLMPS